MAKDSDPPPSFLKSLERALQDVSRAFSPARGTFGVFLSAALGLSVMMASFAAAFLQQGELQQGLLGVIAGTMAVMTAGSTILLYLTRTRSRPSDTRISNRYLETELHEAIARLSNVTRDATAPIISLEPEQKAAITEGVKLAIQNNISAELLQQIEARYGRNIVHVEQIEHFRESCQLARRRLYDEIEALSRRGALNLTIGILTTVIAVLLLGYVALTSQADFSDWIHIASHYVPRLTLVLFIQVFAYFFLRLYRDSLANIKYFQNELTNIELKLVAAEAVFVRDDSDAMKLVLAELVKTERNFVLQKGQTTVDLERSKLEEQWTKDVVRLVNSLHGGKPEK